MDETGFPLGIIQKARVIIDSSIRMKYQSQPDHQEWIMAIESDCHTVRFKDGAPRRAAVHCGAVRYF